MRKRHEQIGAQIAIDFYKQWIHSSKIVEESNYGTFWSEYWLKNKSNFINPEFYYNFFDWEKWKTKEFYGHNNPFTIDFSQGNKQSIQHLLKTIGQVYQYTGWNTKFEMLGGLNNVMLERILEILESLPQKLPGEPDYRYYYDDAKLDICWRNSRDNENTAKLGIRDLHVVNQAIFCSTALYEKAGKLAPEKWTEKNVVEIGGGYGMLAHLLGIINKKTKICIIDLVEASAIQLYFAICMQEYMDTRILAYYPNTAEPVDIGQLSCGSSKESICITIMPSQNLFTQDISKRIYEADAIINFDSFMEMPYSEIKKYFKLINGMKRGGMFIGRNRYRKVSQLSEYPFDDKWDLRYSHSSLLMPWHHELVVRRTGEEKGFRKIFKERVEMYDKYWHERGNAIPQNESINRLGKIT